MQRLQWTALGAAGLFAGATVGGFTLVSATASDRALRGIELQDVVNPETGEPRGQWVDGSVDSATGLPTPRLTLPQNPAASPADTDDGASSSADTTVAAPTPRATSAPAATAQPKATAKPKPVASAESSASTASVASAASTASVASAASTASVASAASAASVASADSSDSSD